MYLVTYRVVGIFDARVNIFDFLLFNGFYENLIFINAGKKARLAVCI